MRCLPATLQLAGVSFVMVIVLSLPIGFLCAVYKDGWFDKIMRALVFMTTAMPAYWVGLLLMWLGFHQTGSSSDKWKWNFKTSDSSLLHGVAELYFHLHSSDPQQYA